MYHPWQMCTGTVPLVKKDFESRATDLFSEVPIVPEFLVQLEAGRLESLTSISFTLSCSSCLASLSWFKEMKKGKSKYTEGTSFLFFLQTSMITHTHTHTSAVVRGQISLSTCWVKFKPDGDNCQQNNGHEINVVMFRPKSKLQVTR